MRTQLILSAHIAGDDGKRPSGRQGREGRDFLSPLKQPLYRNFQIHERRPRACARVEKNNKGVFSRPSRPIRPSDAVGDLRSIACRQPKMANTAGRCHSGTSQTFSGRVEAAPVAVTDDIDASGVAP
jgi:hypothetical protein